MSLDGTRDEEILWLLREEAPPRSLVLHHRKPRFGLPALLFGKEYCTSQNVFFLLHTAFHRLHAPGAVVIESDLALAVDVYEFVPRALDDADHRPSIFTINGYNNHSTAGGPLTEMHENELIVWEWAVSRSLWRLIRNHFIWTNNWGPLNGAHVPGGGTGFVDQIHLIEDM